MNVNFSHYFSIGALIIEPTESSGKPYISFHNGPLSGHISVQEAREFAERLIAAADRAEALAKLLAEAKAA